MVRPILVKAGSFGALMTLLGYVEKFQKHLGFEVPSTVYAGLLYVGILIVAVSIFLWLLEFVIFNAFEAFLPGARYEYERLSHAEIGEAMDVAKRYLGTSPSRNHVKKMIKASPDSFHVIRRVWELKWINRKQVAGFVTIFPIAKATSDLLDKEEISGAQMLPVHLASSFSRAHAIYIGGVAADSFPARAAALVALQAIVEHAELSGVCAIYANPFTKDGLRLAKKFQMAPVSNAAGDHELERIYVRTAGRPRSTWGKRPKRAAKLFAAVQQSPAIGPAVATPDSLNSQEVVSNRLDVN